MHAQFMEDNIKRKFHHQLLKGMVAGKKFN